jgi:hypothetical protein
MSEAQNNSQSSQKLAEGVSIWEGRVVEHPDGKRTFTVVPRNEEENSVLETLDPTSKATQDQRDAANDSLREMLKFRGW